MFSGTKFKRKYFLKDFEAESTSKIFFFQILVKNTKISSADTFIRAAKIEE